MSETSNTRDALIEERKITADILDYVWMGEEVPASIVRDYHVAKAAADEVIGEDEGTISAPHGHICGGCQALMAVYEAAKAYSGMGFPREGSDRTHHITMRLRVRQALAAVDAIIGEVILD